MEADKTGLGSSYILLEEGEGEEAVQKERERVHPGVESAGKRRHVPLEDHCVTILTPRKQNSSVFLTPVKRSKRSVINGVKTGHIKMYDSTVEIRNKENLPFISLVECFKKVERLERTERRMSIDQLVKKYLGNR
ncbi:hypothetical protein NECID01_0191 [Nematocida sp. AWRm77]|nr:hypothetical protein NECID01_0191 [Nematocida sp. AWRm77]